MDYKNKLKQNRMVAIFLIATIIIGCVGLVGFGNLLRSVLFVLPLIILLPTGGYYIINHLEGQKQFVFLALWLGFVFAVTSVDGILIDPRTYPINWLQPLAIVGFIWLGTFLFVVLGIPVYSKILHAWKIKKH